MWLRIFDVEHGQCAIMHDGTNTVLIDAGHNSTTGWRPSTFLQSQSIDVLECFILTNIDEDHASDLHNVTDIAKINLLATNTSVRGKIFEIKDMTGPGIEEASKLLDRYTGPGRKIEFHGLTYSRYFNSYPIDFEDENNLSTVNILRVNDFSICFAGDMEKKGWLKLLQNEKFRNDISDVRYFVASHHGRENGCCEELFDFTGLSPELFIISDSGKQYATQETVDWYAHRAKGVIFGNITRKVLTTRKDGAIHFDLQYGGITLLGK